MFQETSNKYSFKYLKTGIKGIGIPFVFLPEVPKENKILFKKENKFLRPIISELLQEWMDEFEQERDLNPDYIHPHQTELNAWEEKEFEKCINGIFFFNNGQITYITGDYYKYLTQWQPSFGFPDYRESDKEVFYWIKYWEEDGNCYGGLYCTLRREGKSAKMGFWILNRASTNFNHFGGCQGEENTKIQSFYNEAILDPFYKLPYYSKPTYDVSTLQKKGILFKETPKRNKKRIQSKKKLVLGSKIDYRTSEANKYDQAKLHSFVNEEPGKTLTCDISQRWNFVKPCLRLGKKIIGRAFFATTVEFMDVLDKGGKAFKKLCFESDYNNRTKLNQTKSGLYAAMMPADCAYEGFIDEWGFPIKDEARKDILTEREAHKDNPRDYSGLIRKFPLDWNEVFYISTDKCEFNSTILQKRRSELLMNPPQIRRVNLRWENNVRFTKIIISDDPDNGWLKLRWLPKTEEEKSLLNDVIRRDEGGIIKYGPKNGAIFGSGVDPIDHGVVVNDAMNDSEFVSSRRSRPVQFIKRKYDSAIDGGLTPELLVQRAQEEYPYKTNKYIGMMDTRPNDPNVFFERSLMICWLFSMPLKCESQKPGLLNWFHEADCDDFLQDKYVPLDDHFKKSDLVKGTPSSPMMIQELTSLISTDVEYFGHTYDFIEMIDDDLVFDPNNTKPTDYSMAHGWCEVGCKIKPKTVALPFKDIGDYFRVHKREVHIR